MAQTLSECGAGAAAGTDTRILLLRAGERGLLRAGSRPRQFFRAASLAQVRPHLDLDTLQLSAFRDTASLATKRACSAPI